MRQFFGTSAPRSSAEQPARNSAIKASAAQPARHALDLRALDLNAVQPALLFLRSYPVEMVQCELRECLIVVATSGRKTMRYNGTAQRMTRKRCHVGIRNKVKRHFTYTAFEGSPSSRPAVPPA